MTGGEPTRSTEADPIPAEAIREQLERVLASPDFRATARRKQFLRYVVEESLAGHDGRLKGFAIAIAVFDRDEKFDPQLDPIVRLEAGRLRRDLEHYYLTAGQADPIGFDLPKGGYVPSFERRAGAAVEPAGAPAVPSAEIDSDEHDTGSRATSWKRAIPLATGAAALSLAIIAAGLWIWRPLEGGISSPRPSTPAQAPVSLPAQRLLSIAVLPFAMVNGDTEDRYFAEGLSQEVAKSLSRFQSMAVVPPSSIIAAARGEIANARGAALGVNYVLEGTVEKAASAVRVSAQLVDGASGRLVWAESYQRDLDPGRIFEMREDMSLRIAASIGSNHGIATLSSFAKSQLKPPGHLHSFDCMLRFYQHQIRGSEESHLRARDCLERAVERDPDYAAAWASLANVYAQEYRLGFNPTPDRRPPALDRALRAAQRAVELAPTDAIALLMLAQVEFDREDYAAFRRLGETAMRLSPGDPDVLSQFGLRLAFIGEWGRGLSLVQKAVDVSAFHPPWYHYPFAFHSYLQGEYEQALSTAQKLLPVGLFGYDFFAAMSFAKSNRPELARAAAARLVAAHPNASAKFWDLMRAWKFRPADAENMADGLRKAGIAIAPP